MKPLEKHLPANTTTDVAQFFMDITAAYLELEQNILVFLHKLPACTPEQVLHECRQLAMQRNELAEMDKQMFRILEIAGTEIAATHLIHDFRLACAKSLMASNILYQKLQAMKMTILEDISVALPA